MIVRSRDDNVKLLLDMGVDEALTCQHGGPSLNRRQWIPPSEVKSYVR